MSQVTPLVRVVGTAHGIRTVNVPGKAAVYDDEGHVKYNERDPYSYDEVGVAVRGRYGDTLTEGLTGTVAVRIRDGEPRPVAGEAVDWQVLAWTAWVDPGRGRRPFPTVAYGYAGPGELEPARELAAAAAPRPARR